MFLMGRPHLDLTPIGMNTKNEKISHMDLTPIDTKISDPKPLIVQTSSSKLKEKAGNSTYQRNQSQTHHCQTNHLSNMIRLIAENTANQKARDMIYEKVSETHQTVLVRLTAKRL